MATSTPLAGPDARSLETLTLSRSRLALVPRSLLVHWHLLSLDAPSVATVWTWFIASACGIHLPPDSILAMSVAVWLLYVTDRLLDSVTSVDLEARHLFHRKHRKLFSFGIFVSGVCLAFLIPRLPTSALRLFTLLGGLLLAYFILIHLSKAPTPRMPKEIAVGVFFSAATFIPTVARNPALRSQLLPSAVLFGLACSLNCLFIYAWEHPVTSGSHRSQQDAHPATRLGLKFLPQISSFTVLACLALTQSVSTAIRQLLLAIAVSIMLLLVLHRLRRHFNNTTLRATADLCLLTPVAFSLMRLL